MITDLRTFRSKSRGQHRDAEMGIAVTTHEYVQGSELALGPGMDADMGFRQNHNPGNPEPGAKPMDVGMKDGCARGTGCVPKRGFGDHRIG